VASPRRRFSIDDLKAAVERALNEFGQQFGAVRAASAGAAA
jgi:hypothetical protein